MSIASNYTRNFILWIWKQIGGGEKGEMRERMNFSPLPPGSLILGDCEWIGNDDEYEISTNYMLMTLFRVSWIFYNWLHLFRFVSKHETGYQFVCKHDRVLYVE